MRRRSQYFPHSKQQILRLPIHSITELFTTSFDMIVCFVFADRRVAEVWVSLLFQINWMASNTLNWHTKKKQMK